MSKKFQLHFSKKSGNQKKVFNLFCQKFGHRPIHLKFRFLEMGDFNPSNPIDRKFDQSAADGHINRILSMINHRILMHIHRETH